MKKYKLIALIGESGSGKDTILQKALLNKFLNKVIIYTTRPPRENEKDGVNYNFVSENEFKQMKMLATSEFRGWYYGVAETTLSAHKINIGVYDITMLQQILENTDIYTKVFYIESCERTRLLRQLTREKHPDINEIERRLHGDREDFSIRFSFTHKHLINESYLDLWLSVFELWSYINHKKWK